MLNSNIIKKRLELLLHDVVTQNNETTFKIAILDESELGDTFILSLLSENNDSIYVLYSLKSDFWKIRINGEDEYKGTSFNYLINMLVHEVPFYNVLFSAPYEYETHFFIYQEVRNYNNRFPASTKEGVLSYVEAMKKAAEKKNINKIIIENADSGQIIEMVL